MAKKVVIVGDAAIGKTKWVVKLLGGTSPSAPYQEGKYIPTQGVEVHPFHYKGQHYKLWDTAGDLRYAGLSEGYYVGADMFVLIHTINTSPDYWLEKIRRVSDGPVLFCYPEDLETSPTLPFD